MPRRSPKSTDGGDHGDDPHDRDLRLDAHGERSSSLWMPALMEFTPKPAKCRRPRWCTRC